MAKLIASAGPFSGVRFIGDAPYEDSGKFLYDARNGYFRQADGVVSWLARPGFTCTNPAAQMGSGQRSQGAVAFTDPSSGTIYRFFVVNGVLYRSDSSFTTFTAVTPGTIAIDNAQSTRVTFTVVGASVVVNDGVNRPWVMTAYASTPVTGAYIDIDGAGGSWSAFGKPTVYQDSIMFITKTVPGGSAITPRVGIVWSEPNQPTVGYTQTGYADFWNIIENNTEPLTAILGTNNGLFYFRANSIGVATGTPSINFSTTATRDYRGDPVGTTAAHAVTLFEDNIFFLDAKSRPWMMSIGGDPQPIWQQLASTVATLSAAQLDPTFLAWNAIGSVVPELNQVILAFGGAPTSPTSRQSPPNGYVFDGASGAYAGSWAPGNSIVGFDALAVLLDANGARVLYLGGGVDVPSPQSGGYVWILNALGAGIWQDTASGFPSITSSALITTHAMGYAADRLLYPDTVTFIVRSSDSVRAQLTTSSISGFSANVAGILPQTGGAATVQAFRATLGLDGIGTRYLRFSVNPDATITAQWGLTRIEVFGSTGPTGPDDR